MRRRTAVIPTYGSVKPTRALNQRAYDGGSGRGRTSLAPGWKRATVGSSSRSHGLSNVRGAIHVDELRVREPDLVPSFRPASAEAARDCDAAVVGAPLADRRRAACTHGLRGSTAARSSHRRNGRAHGGDFAGRCRQAPRRELGTACRPRSCKPRDAKAPSIAFARQRHLLAVYEQGVRRDGDTFVEGLPRSSLRDLKRKLTFVPAGHEYHERQEPRVLTRVVYFYFDPAKMPTHSENGAENAPLAPRLFFEDAALWDTALKLKRLIESGSSDNRLYLEALGVVLAHELVRLNAGAPRVDAPVRGGLAAWQQRIVTGYIEEHLGEQIPLATMAQLVRLSPVLLLPGVQAIVRRAAASLSQPAPHRARQDAVGQACALGDRYRNDGRLQRDQLVHRGVSQGHRADADRVSPRPRVTCRGSRTQESRDCSKTEQIAAIRARSRPGTRLDLLVGAAGRRVPMRRTLR